MTVDAETFIDPLGNNPDAARRLWDRWQVGPPPDLAEFLDQYPTMAAGDLASVLCVDLRERLRRGERVPAEHYFQTFPMVGGNHEAALDVAYSEFLGLEEVGESPTLEDYRTRFPELFPELGQQIEMHGALEAGRIESTTLFRPGREDTLSVHPGEVEAAPAWPALPGYEVVGRLGQGGMGVVYRARQATLNRFVAVKMLRLGAVESPDARSRFRIEGEAVARLQHPNIVQVFEVGEHSGRPFLVMEYAEGGSLAQALDGTPWLARDAARLAGTLALAVDYAHRRGVIHRDLTPGNILLASGGTPKLSDFGLAKILLDEQEVTRTGDVLGTPSYMSPEQASGSSRRGGPAIDIYALGAILYELLTGRAPFKAPTPLMTLAQVMNSEPLAPRRLQPGIPKDLETICLTCLNKEPARRYGSAAALAEDLRRFQAGEPILARPVGWVERAWRLALRKKLAASLLASLAVVSLVGIGMVTWEWRIAVEARARAERQEAEATRQRIKAEERLIQTCTVVDDMLTRVGSDMMASTPDADRVRRELLERAVSMLDNLRSQAGDDPFVRERSAYACRRTTELLHQLGRSAEALAMSERALTQTARLVADDPNRPAYRTELAACRNVRANLFSGRGDLARAALEHDEAIEIERELIHLQPEDPLHRWRYAISLFNRAVVWREMKKPDQASKAHREALAIRQALVAEDPGRSGYRVGLATSHYSLANLLVEIGQVPEAIDHFGTSIDLLTEEVANDFINPLALQILAQAHRNRGNLKAGNDRRQDHARALELFERLVEDHPRDRRYREDLAPLCGEMAQLLATEDPSESLRLQRDGIKHFRKLIATAPIPTSTRYGLGSALVELAARLKDGGGRDEARKLADEGIAHLSAALEADPRNETYRGRLGRGYLELAEILERQGLHAEASKAIAGLAKLCPDSIPDLHSGAVNLIWCMMLADRDARLDDSSRPKAIELYAREARDLYRRTRDLGSENYGVWYALAILDLDLDGVRAGCSDLIRRFARPETSPEALHWIARASAIAAVEGDDLAPLLGALEASGQADPSNYANGCAIGALLLRAGRLDEARQRLEAVSKLHSPGAALDRLLLSVTYRKLGRSEDALRCRGEALDWLKRTEGGRLSSPLYPRGLSRWDWLELRMIRREAEAGLEGVSKPPGSK